MSNEYLYTKTQRNREETLNTFFKTFTKVNKIYKQKEIIQQRPTKNWFRCFGAFDESVLSIVSTHLLALIVPTALPLR